MVWPGQLPAPEPLPLVPPLPVLPGPLSSCSALVVWAMQASLSPDCWAFLAWPTRSSTWLLAGSPRVAMLVAMLSSISCRLVWQRSLSAAKAAGLASSAAVASRAKRFMSVLQGVVSRRTYLMNCCGGAEANGALRLPGPEIGTAGALKRFIYMKGHPCPDIDQVGDVLLQRLARFTR